MIKDIHAAFHSILLILCISIFLFNVFSLLLSLYPWRRSSWVKEEVANFLQPLAEREGVSGHDSNTKGP